jgi:hypothetical protein
VERQLVRGTDRIQTKGSKFIRKKVNWIISLTESRKTHASESASKSSPRRDLQDIWTISQNYLDMIRFTCLCGKRFLCALSTPNNQIPISSLQHQSFFMIELATVVAKGLLELEMACLHPCLQTRTQIFVGCASD